MILSAAMMLSWLGERHEDDRCAAAAQGIEHAVEHALASGLRTHDLGGSASTQEVVDAVVGALSAQLSTQH